MAEFVAVVSAKPANFDHHTVIQHFDALLPEFKDFPTGLSTLTATKQLIKLDQKKANSRHVTKSGAYELRTHFCGAYGNLIVNKNAAKTIYYEIHCPKQYVQGMAWEMAKHFPLFCRKRGAQENIKNSAAHFHFVNCDLSAGEIENLNAVVKGIRKCQMLRDIPAEDLNTTDLAQHAINIADQYEHVTATVFTGEELVKEGLNAIYAVGRAGVKPPSMVVLKIEGSDPDAAPVGVIAKGIVYDSGGLALKARPNMRTMKGDMGGAGALIGATQAIAEMAVKPKHTFYAICCIAENAIGPNSFRHDDILEMHSGNTVEVNNTDAEGRLVMSDGISYATRNLGCKTVFDIATLTGIARGTTGHNHGSMLTNDEDLEWLVRKAGLFCGEMVFPVVYAPECHFFEYNSLMADFKNSVAHRDNAQTSCAGLFVGANIKDGFDFDGKWCHLDFCAPSSMYGYERGTGYPVALMVSVLSKVADFKADFNFSDY